MITNLVALHYKLMLAMSMQAMLDTHQRDLLRFRIKISLRRD